MLVARAPLRVPLAGGLTDLRPYAERFGGVTVSATIDLSARVTWLPSLSGRFEVVAEGRVQEVRRVEDVENDLVRTALASVDPAHEPVRLAVWLDVEGNSGLGASGAISTALVHAAVTARGEALDPARLGAWAARLEVEELDGASGYHDANVSARGGLRRLEYAGAVVTDVPLGLTRAREDALLGTLLLFATGRRGVTRSSLAVLLSRLEEALPVLHDIKGVALELTGALAAGDPERFARCVGEQQRLKQLLPGDFVDDEVTSLVARVERHGASAQVPGGKIGGYLLVACPHGQQAAVRAELGELREVPLFFTREGSSVRWV